MAAHGHTTTWGTYIGVGRAPQGQGWYAQFNTWWAARQHARLANLRAQWDAKREAVHPVPRGRRDRHGAGIVHGCPRQSLVRAQLIGPKADAASTPQAVPPPRGLRLHLRLVIHARP